MFDFEEKLLILLVEKYRKSKKDNGTNRIHRATRVKPTDLYKGYNRNDGDLEQIDAVNHAVEKCCERGFLTFRMNGFSNEILSIDLIDEKVEEAERYLSEKYQYESKHEKIRYIEGIIARYSGSSPIADLECEKLKMSLNKNRIPKQYLQTEDILKALVFIEGNNRLLYVREASMLIYGSSKYLEDNTLESVCRLIRSYHKRPCEENELPDEILSEYSIVKERQKICLKGNITIQKAGGQIELRVFDSGIEFYADELQQIQRIEVHTSKFITVENRTSYMRCQGEDTSYFYLGGYVNRFQRDFLKIVYRDNPVCLYFHFGDIDAGGFYIHEHLCRVTGIPFQMYQMSIRQLQEERYQTCLQNLTGNDKKRLSSLCKQESYQALAEYMLEHDVKLEQEIISYYLDTAE